MPRETKWLLWIANNGIPRASIAYGDFNKFVSVKGETRYKASFESPSVPILGRIELQNEDYSLSLTELEKKYPYAPPITPKEPPTKLIPDIKFYADLIPQHGVEIAIRNDGNVAWINVDGICVMRLFPKPGAPIVIEDARLINDMPDVSTVGGDDTGSNADQGKEPPKQSGS